MLLPHNWKLDLHQAMKQCIYATNNKHPSLHTSYTHQWVPCLARPDFTRTPSGGRPAIGPTPHRLRHAAYTSSNGSTRNPMPKAYSSSMNYLTLPPRGVVLSDRAQTRYWRSSIRIHQSPHTKLCHWLGPTRCFKHIGCDASHHKQAYRDQQSHSRPFQARKVPDNVINNWVLLHTWLWKALVY